MAHRNSAHSLPLQEQSPNLLWLGIRIPLDNSPPLHANSISPIANDEANDNFSGLYYKTDVEALSDWATVILFMRRSIGYVVQKPVITDDFE